MLTWPIATIDFEASGLGPSSYPIEVGVAVWTAIDAPITVWSTLIRPCPEWELHGEWNARSAAIHKIERQALASGMPASTCAAEVARLSQSCGGLFADGGQHDAFWLSRLLSAGEVAQTFALKWWQIFVRELPYEVADSILTYHERVPTPHRAGEDASRLLIALALAYGVDAQVRPVSIGHDQSSSRFLPTQPVAD